MLSKIYLESYNKQRSSLRKTLLGIVQVAF